MSSKDMSNFSFLQAAWPQLSAEGQKAEALVVPDPRAACFYARRALELAVTWLYKSDTTLKLPYQDNLSALIIRAPSRAGCNTSSQFRW
jgi:type I restriction enzyme R subunit